MKLAKGAIAWVALVFALLAPPAAAQVDSPTPLAVISEDGVSVHHAPARAEFAGRLLRHAVAERSRIAHDLGLDAPPQLDIYALPRKGGDDPEAHGLPGGPDWASGMALVDEPVIILRTGEELTAAGPEALTVLSHEIVHAVSAAALGPGRHSTMPAWFREGVASTLAYEWRLTHGAHAAGLTMTRNYIPLAQLHQGFPHDGPEVGLAYLEAFAFVRWLVEREGIAGVRKVMQGLDRGEPFGLAFANAFGATPSQLEKLWKRGFLWRYRWIPIASSSTTLWLIVVGSFVLGAWGKRRRSAATLRRWEVEEREDLARRGWRDDDDDAGDGDDEATADEKREVPDR